MIETIKALADSGSSLFCKIPRATMLIESFVDYLYRFKDRHPYSTFIFLFKYYWNKEMRMASCMTLPKLRTWDGQTTTWKQDYSIEYNSTARALQASETRWVNTSNSTEGEYVDVQEGWTVGHTTEDDYASRASDSCGNFSTFNKKQYHR